MYSFVPSSTFSLLHKYYGEWLDGLEKPENLDEQYSELVKLNERYLKSRNPNDWKLICERSNASQAIALRVLREEAFVCASASAFGQWVSRSDAKRIEKHRLDAMRYFGERR